ncbi:MAG: alpha/beta fold hydrolase [Bdellovibrionota bacterium]
MSKFETNDGTQIYYKDWGTGQPIVFSHGWPLTADAWDAQMLFFLEKGYRVIAHDRRGHGRSSQTWDHNTMDQYANDLSALINHLNLNDIVLVGHSTGGGEVTRYIGLHGTSRVSRIVLVGAVPPLMLKSGNNSGGIPLEVFDDIRTGLSTDRSQYYRDFSLPFFGFNRKGAKISEGLRESFWLQCMMGGIKGQYDSIAQFSETDFTDDLAKFDVPTLIIHGEDDQIVPINISARISAKLVEGAELRVYPGAPHALPQTLPEKFNADLLAFVESGTANQRKSA